MFVNGKIAAVARFLRACRIQATRSVQAVTTLPDLTEDQLARRLATSFAEQRRYFERYGLVVVPTRGKADGMPRLLQLSVEAWARGRFMRGADASNLHDPRAHGGEG